MNEEKKEAGIEILEIIQQAVANAPQGALNQVSWKIPYKQLLAQVGVPEELYDEFAPYIEELGLDDPIKLAKILIDIHLAGLESINDGIASIRNDLLTSEISKISAVRDKIDDIGPNDDRNALMKQYTDDMIDVVHNIEGKVTNYIAEIQEVDNLPSWKFFVQANFNKSKVKTAVKLSKAALRAYFEALSIQTIMFSARGNIDMKTQNNYLEKRLKFIESLKVKLVYAYDAEKDSFLNKETLKSKVNEIKLLPNKMNNVAISYDKNSTDNRGKL